MIASGKKLPIPSNAAITETAPNPASSRPPPRPNFASKSACRSTPSPSTPREPLARRPFLVDWRLPGRGYLPVVSFLEAGGGLSAGLDFGKFDVLAFVQNAGNDRFDIAFGGNRNGTSGVTQAPGTTYGVSTRVNF